MRPLLVLPCLLALGHIHAQDLDSLRLVWRDTDRPDSLRFKACYDLVWDGYLFSDPDSALLVADQLQDTARKHGSAQYDALAYDLQAAAWYVKGDLRKALSFYEISLPMHEARGDVGSMADVIGNMGSMYSFLGEHNQALALYDKALTVHTKEQDTLAMANDINALGGVYMVRGEHGRAIEHYTRSLHMLHAIKNDRGIATGLINLGAVHLLQGDYRAALSRYTQALAIAERIGDKDQLATLLPEIGTCHEQLGDTASAMAAYHRCKMISAELGDQRALVNALNKMGGLTLAAKQALKASTLFHEARVIAQEHELAFGHATALIGAGHSAKALGRASEALALAERARSIADRTDDISLKRDAAELLYQLHRNAGRTDQALLQHEAFVLYRDSMVREENQRETLHAQYAYDHERRALADSLAHQDEEHRLRIAHAEQLAQEHLRRTWLIAALLVAAAVAIAVFVRMRTMQRANLAIQAAQDRVVEVEKQREAEAVRTRIARDIHDDMGGDITKIGLLSHEARLQFDKDPGSALGTLTRIGDLSRDVSHALQDVVNTVDPRSDDLALVMTHAKDMVTRLLEGTALNAELGFQHHGIPRTLDPERKRSMLLLLKEAVNNALKHAGASSLTISFTTDNNGFDLLVKDDGRGFDTTARGGGNGLRNMHARANALGAEILITTAPGRGCTIHVHGGLDVQPTTNVVFPTAHPLIDLRP